MTADVLKSNARSVDVPARIGGEEFNVLLPGVGSEGAMIAAERIRKSIEEAEIAGSGSQHPRSDSLSHGLRNHNDIFGQFIRVHDRKR